MCSAGDVTVLSRNLKVYGSSKARIFARSASSEHGDDCVMRAARSGHSACLKCVLLTKILVKNPQSIVTSNWLGKWRTVAG